MSILKLRELIKDVKVAMFTTIDENGLIRSRPLSTLDTDAQEGVGELWFFTSGSSPKVDEILEDQHVNLSYADPVHQRYVSVSGTATATRDLERIRRLWKPVHKAWFPEGVDDPKLTLIHVKIIRAEYWDAPSSGIVNAFGIAKAIMLGETYEPGENEKLRLRNLEDADAGR